MSKCATKLTAPLLRLLVSEMGLNSSSLMKLSVTYALNFYCFVRKEILLITIKTQKTRNAVYQPGLKNGCHNIQSQKHRLVFYYLRIRIISILITLVALCTAGNVITQPQCNSAGAVQDFLGPKAEFDLGPTNHPLQRSHNYP